MEDTEQEVEQTEHINIEEVVEDDNEAPPPESIKYFNTKPVSYRFSSMRQCFG